MISDCVAKYTNTTTCAHIIWTMQKLRLSSGYTCTRRCSTKHTTPETCDGSVFEIG